MSSASQPILAVFHKSVIGASLGQPAEERSLKHDFSVVLFINVDGNASRVVTAMLSGRADDETGTLQLHMYSHILPPAQKRR